VRDDDGYDAEDNARGCYDLAIATMRDRLAAFRCEQIGPHKLYLGDCRELLPLLGTVDAVVTSPPYAQQRDYGSKIDDWAGLVGILAATPDHGKTQVLVNLGLVYRDGELFEYWDGLKAAMRASGWRMFGHYVWDKGFGAPGNWSGRLAPSHEYIFHFNRAAVEPAKWVPTQQRVASGTGLRRADGTMSGVSSPDKAGQPLKIPDSVIRMPPHQARGQIENDHPAIFPVALPRHLIMTFTGANGIVCDPFMGSGTTGVAAAKLGRRFIGIELEPTYFDIACRRIEAATRQPDLFIEPPSPKPEQLSLLAD
jgi:DNA modification methylase